MNQVGSNNKLKHGIRKIVSFAIRLNDTWFGASPVSENMPKHVFYQKLHHPKIQHQVIQSDLFIP